LSTAGMQIANMRWCLLSVCYCHKKPTYCVWWI